MISESGKYRCTIRKTKQGLYNVYLFAISPDPHYDDMDLGADQGYSHLSAAQEAAREWMRQAEKEDAE